MSELESWVSIHMVSEHIALTGPENAKSPEDGVRIVPFTSSSITFDIVLILSGMHFAFEKIFRNHLTLLCG
jgi:hypothetical protein